MRGISEEKLKRLLDSFGHHTEIIDIYSILLDECQELHEPWMTLEEFLRSGFVGFCWIYSVYKDIFAVQFIDGNFISINTGAKAQLKYIERVMPIHKPEMPR